MNLPRGLSPRYWQTWYPPRSGVSVAESLEPGETWIGGWDGIGLYEGNNKVPAYQTLAFHLTTHRILLVPSPSPSPTPSSSASTTSTPPALQTHLRHVRQTEFYTGFMRSSAKITLTLGPPPPDTITDREPTAGASSSGGGGGGEGWTCGVCGYVNALSAADFGGRPSATAKCGLCGVAYAVGSRSLPSSRPSTPAPAPPPLPPPVASASPSSPLSTSSSPPPLSASSDIPCPACTFLNHPSMTRCEVCSTPLPQRHGKSVQQEPAGGEESSQIVRLSFRQGGEKEAYRRVKNVLSEKGWEAAPRSRSHNPDGSGEGQEGVDGTEAPRAGAGIDGILRAISLENTGQDETMKSAFKDLEVLMVRAGEMVRLAQSLSAKLAASPSPTQEETTLIRSSLVQLGLPAPALTPDMVKDQRVYHEGLARELGALLTGREGGRSQGLMVGSTGRGVIGLDEVWGLWMRARGVALLPPKTLVSVLPFLPSSTSPSIHLQTLPSGLQVLRTPHYSSPAILSRTLDRLAPQPGAEAEPSMSVLDFAGYEDLPIGLAKEMIESVERDEGGVVRDEQGDAGGGGVRWYRDIISATRVEDL